MRFSESAALEASVIAAGASNERFSESVADTDSVWLAVADIVAKGVSFAAEVSNLSALADMVTAWADAADAASIIAPPTEADEESKAKLISIR